MTSRRRGSELERAILRAAADELIESGYAGLTMDRVAKRAGTNKNAIYRRWPNRAALGVAAHRQLVATEQQLPDTGTLREDALALLRKLNRDASTPAADVHRALLASIGDDPELLAQLLDYAAGAAGSWLAVLERAVARGEARPWALHPRVATVALVLLRNEYLTRAISAPVDDEVLVEIVDEVYLPLVRGRGSAAK